MQHRVLVVDDEPDLELLITQKFRKRIRAGELAFSFARHGEDALTQLGESAGLVDVVLSDINMPVMDGLTLLGKIRERFPLPRTVIVSAYGDMPNIRTALNRGAFDFLTKPIDFQDLEITLDKALGEALARRQAAADRDRLSGLHRELDVARSIQESLTPRVFPTDARCEVHGAMIPAAQVGGDLFDVFPLDANRLAFVIGDVSGKGVGAAIYMAISRTVLRVIAGKGLAPHECLTEVNRYLCRERRTPVIFLTCFYAILNLATGVLEYSRAGHNPPYLIGSSVEPLKDAQGLPLGVFSSGRYTTATRQLEPGDTLLLFTDGITESMTLDQDEFGEDRLIALLQQQAPQAPTEIITSAVTAAARQFASGAPASDDMTVLAVRYRGAI